MKHPVEPTFIRFKAPVVFAPGPFPVYLKQTWLGSRSQRFSDRLSACVTFASILSICTFYLILLICSHFSSRIVCLTCKLVPRFINLKYRCEDKYLAPTNMHVETWMEQYLPAYIRQGGASNRNCLTQTVWQSVIGLHLINNPCCASQYVDMKVTVM